MKKKVFIITVLLTITGLLFWFSCNFSYPQQSVNLYSTALVELDGPDQAKASAPPQPDIYIPQVLLNFRDTLYAGGLPTIRIYEETDASTIANYIFHCQSYPPKYLVGDFKYFDFKVYATETSAEIFFDTMTAYYVGGDQLPGKIYYDGYCQLLVYSGIANPTTEQVLIFFKKVYQNNCYIYANGDILIKMRSSILYNGSYENTIYRKGGETAVHLAAGWYSQIADIPGN